MNTLYHKTKKLLRVIANQSRTLKLRSKTVELKGITVLTFTALACTSENTKNVPPYKLFYNSAIVIQKVET